ncbi:MAG: hypothetical protein QOF20_688 [Acidimicrobiaceae bacterium]|jgi:hypothetical protein|nr:hypothetical protein [Acidimicrobiaceae bacterium]MDQ1365908.1 hypothetical protein [Acidimicrobiaceae bacterium]MDQ1368335.1 hypothetical protein [Acidimicrobiaceae bacterium]MDQ1377050.1 hypothetical protein [Acidimicrobiaceae bacterium]MDQ1400541.1 hypothetical protein [Acidimicrobiaceae bacterium]
MSAPLPELVAVPVLRIPVAIWARTQEHIDELLREFTLIAAQLRDRPGGADVPVRLIQLVQDLTEDYGGLNTDQEDRLAKAADAGLAEIDLVYQIPREAAVACRHLQEMLDEADAYCLDGEHLLTLATPMELNRFRRWFLEEFVRQLDGAAPTPWPDYQG